MFFSIFKQRNLELYNFLEEKEQEKDKVRSCQALEMLFFIRLYSVLPQGFILLRPRNITKGKLNSFATTCVSHTTKW